MPLFGLGTSGSTSAGGRGRAPRRDRFSFVETHRCSPTSNETVELLLSQSQHNETVQVSIWRSQVDRTGRCHTEEYPWGPPSTRFWHYAPQAIHTMLRRTKS